MNGIPAMIGLCLLLLAGCGKSRQAGSNISLGSLVCPDSAALAGVRSVSLPDRCPLLIVGFNEETHRAIAMGSGRLETSLDLSAFEKTGDVRLPQALIRITDTAIFRSAPGPKPGMSIPRFDFGLIVGAAGKPQDTVFVPDLPAFQTDSFAVADLGACLEALARSPGYGFLNAPFAPDLICGGRPPMKLTFLAKPDPRSADRRDWIFLSTSERRWLWRIQGGPVSSVEAPFMETSVLESVVAEDMDGDSIPELIATAADYAGHGLFPALHVIRGGGKEDPPRPGTLYLNGSPGKTDGSMVEAQWWIKAPRLYHAYAQSINEAGMGRNHDIRIDAYGFSGAKGFAKELESAFTMVFFGPVDSKWNTEARCDSLLAQRPEARNAGVRPLPRLTPDGVAWQMGAIAPDLKTAERWRDWDGTGVILELSRR